MTYFQAIILAIVEGITEFLPISSTGHLVLTSNLLFLPQTDFVKSFEIIIQLGSILAVVFIYWKTLTKNLIVWKNILAAFIPTALIGFALYKFIKQYLIGNVYITLFALLIGGIVLILLELFYKSKEHDVDHIENLTLKQSFFIGLAQSISIIPGVSRSAASIFGALLLGANRKVAVEFSFLLAIPTMFAATTLDLIQTDFSFSPYELSLLGVGLITSFIVALLVVKWFLRFVQKNSFIPFGIYRILLAILFWLFIL